MDNEFDALTRRSESPTVLALQDQVESKDAFIVELLDLLNMLIPECRGIVDGKVIGPNAHRLNMATGRV